VIGHRSLHWPRLDSDDANASGMEATAQSL
jgi:hypothetical protein